MKIYEVGKIHHTHFILNALIAKNGDMHKVLYFDVQKTLYLPKATNLIEVIQGGNLNGNLQIRHAFQFDVN